MDALASGMAVSVELGANDEVIGVTTYFGITFRCSAAVLTTGTFMNGQIWVGRKSMAAGRAGEGAALFVCPMSRVWSRLSNQAQIWVGRKSMAAGRAGGGAVLLDTGYVA